MERGGTVESSPVILGRTGEATPVSKKLTFKSGPSDGSFARDTSPRMAPSTSGAGLKQAGSLSSVSLPSSSPRGAQGLSPAVRPQLSRNASRVSRVSHRSRVAFAARHSESNASTIRSTLSNLAMVVRKSTTRVLAIKFTQVFGDADGDETLRGWKLADDSDDEAQDSEDAVYDYEFDLEQPPVLDDEVNSLEQVAEATSSELAAEEEDGDDYPAMAASRSWPSLTNTSGAQVPSLLSEGSRRGSSGSLPRSASGPLRVASQGSGPRAGAASRDVAEAVASVAGTSCQSGTSGWELARLVLNLVLRYPVHCLKELRFYVLPLICSLVPTIAAGMVMRTQANSLIPVQEQVSMEEVYDSDGLPQAAKLVGLVPQVIMDVALLLTTLSFCWTLWAWKAVWRPIVRVALPAFLVVLALHAVGFVMDQEGHGASATWKIVRQAMTSLMQAVLITGTAFYVGHFTRNRLVMKVYAGILLIVICLYSLCRVFAEPILNGSDRAKAFFAAVLNPILFEIFISGARLVARCVRKNDSSTSFLLVAPLISLKHTVGRFMTAMIMDPQWVLLVSICNGVGEIVLQSTMPKRDAALYHLLFRPFLKDGEAPEQQMQNSRNRALRMNSAMFETMSEIVATWSGAAMVLAIGISRDGETLPKASSLIESALMQTGIEVFIDLAAIILMFMINRYDTLKLAARRRWYWSIPVCPFVAFSSALLTWSLLFKVLCVVPDKDVTIWTVCIAG